MNKVTAFTGALLFLFPLYIIEEQATKVLHLNPIKFDSEQCPRRAPETEE